jgi:DNA-binding CsgD family transcriptional regulator
MENDETKKIFELIQTNTSLFFISLPKSQSFLFEELIRLHIQKSNKNEIICLAFLDTNQYATHIAADPFQHLGNLTKQNTDFDEIILLAKENSPNFLIRFQDAYSDFCDSILRIYPDIQNSELIFCAYLRLNFSTKEIAKFTFVSPKSVQMRKYRLRKKLNIPSDKDIYMWMKSIDKKK